MAPKEKKAMGKRVLKTIKLVFEISIEALAILYVITNFPIGAVQFVYEGY